uniref:Uncharacterized protein n=1 Tax=Panagrolaimus superbus TaxID=310955 RepID=A0A914YSA8_9BILA
MSAGLAEACKSNLCQNLIFLENKISPNVMYRMGAQSDAKNREKYSGIKRQKFEEWLEKRHRRKRSKRRKAGSEMPEIDEAQAFIDIHIQPSKNKDPKKSETVKEKSKPQQQQQSDDEEE